MANSLIYQEDWAVKLQERLSEPNKWKEVCNVEFTNEKVLHNPYMSDMTVQSGTRGSAYTHQDVSQTDETVTIDNFDIAPQLIDRADLAQSQYTNQMILAERQGTLLDESIETQMLANHADWTDFGDADIGGSGSSTTQITVSVNNVDDIIRGMKTKIREADGENMANRNGMFIIWRPADFELLEAYVQANGFSTADGALKDGTNQGFSYMGVQHFSSNKHASNHLFGGVKKVYHLGIVRSTFGQVVIDQEPATSGGAVSGIGVVTRADYKFKAWNFSVPILFDINVT